MNEISATVALWIFDAWRRLGSQLQTRYWNPAGTAVGDIVRIIRTDPTGATISMEAVGRASGQNSEWDISLDCVKLFFDVSTESAASTLTIEFSNGNKVLLAEVPE